MPRERLVIIGGVAAGMSAASRARRVNAQLEIVVLEKGRHVSYGACGLPYYLSGQVADWKDLLAYPPEFFREKRGIEIQLGHEATEIEPGRKAVHALAPGGRPVSFPYDKLVIATGGAPAITIDGANLPGVFTCNDLAGAIRLREFLDQRKPVRAVIAGSGYIGLEVADAFVSRGMKVTILERSETALEGVEPEIAARIEGVLEKHGVRLRKSSAVTAITKDGAGEGLHVHHGTGGSEPADVVVIATGILPKSQLADSAGIPLGATGAIAVDDRMQTGVNSIYAAGDCAEARHLVTGKPTYFPLGTTANKQGRVAGENAAGGNARFEGIVGTLATKFFELEVAKTGLGAAQARANGFDADSVTLTSISRAKYLGGKPITVTLVWDRPSGRLLGCQMADEEGVAKRIDVAAMALHARMRIPEMLHLDLSYAPPFAPVWDPLLVAANEAMKKFRR
jgi:NADPH-dependent 2,4-dienoyl-CoA reductase/sulfur reductase-like enzyme